jgi:hypothetical protein
MQRCPKCGYREGADWLAVLCVVAFSVLYFVFTFPGYEYHVPKSYRLVGVCGHVPVYRWKWVEAVEEQTRQERVPEAASADYGTLKGSFEA